MSKSRIFFIDPEMAHSGLITLTGRASHHLRNVLRMKPGEEIILTDGRGHYQGKIAEIQKNAITVEIGERIERQCSLLQVILAQGIPKGKRMDWIIEKATEIGVSRIVPLQTERCVLRLSPKEQEHKQKRWQMQAIEACKQSGNDLPIIDLPASLDSFLQESHEGLRLILWEEANIGTLRELLSSSPNQTQVTVIVGPEGGFSEKEISLAKHKGFHPVSLGRNILRSETAPISILSILHYLWGELG